MQQNQNQKKQLSVVVKKSAFFFKTHRRSGRKKSCETCVAQFPILQNVSCKTELYLKGKLEVWVIQSNLSMLIWKRKTGYQAYIIYIVINITFVFSC